MVTAAVIGLMYAWFSFIVIGGIAVLMIAALCYTCGEVWRDIKRKLKVK
jgi:hypothetical protein